MPIRDLEERRRYHREWRARRRAEYFKDKHCARCGTTKNLTLDHVDRLTKVSHSIWSWSQVRREEELAKCQVLCWPCHKQKTAEDLNYGNIHGARRYGKGCRCSVCIEDKNQERARYRQRKKARK